jgi:hypothetical protein
MTEQQRASAELARRMGWTQRHTTDIIAAKLAGDWIRPDGSFYDREGWPPDYFTNAAASRELVLWLAKQKGFEVERFNNLIADKVRDYGFQATPLQILAADLSVIARAACKALGIATED